MRRVSLQFCLDQNGATALEYAFIASMISITIVVNLQIIGTQLLSWYLPIATNLQ